MPSVAEGVKVHPSSVLSDEAQIGPGAVIGPGCVLHGRVVLEAGVRLIGGVHLSGPIRVGAGTTIYPFACLGFGPQDVKFKPGDPTAGVEIGPNCLIREHVTVHASTRTDRPTRIGESVFMMAGSHAGHDAQVGSHCVLVNSVALAGHVEVGERATLGGQAAMHQFCRVGRLAFVGGHASMAQDVPPFCIAAERNMIVGMNVVGLRRLGVERDRITLLRRAYREVIRARRTRPEIIAGLRSLGGGDPLVEELAGFYETSRRGVAPSAAFPPARVRTWVKRAVDPAWSGSGEDDADGG